MGHTFGVICLGGIYGELGLEKLGILGFMALIGIRVRIKEPIWI